MSQVEPLTQVNQAPAPLTAQGVDDAWKRLYIAAGVTIAAYLPLLCIHILRLDQHEQYSFYPLVPVGVAALVWSRWPEVHRLRPGQLPITILIVCFAAMLHVVAVIMYSPYIAAVSFLILLLGVMYGLCGSNFVRKMLPAWAFLWLMIPLPFNLDTELVQSLQRVTALWSSRILDWRGILHIMTGNAVELPGQKLLIEEACSGVQSLFACVAFTLFYLFWFRHPILRGTLVFLSSIGWVLLANALRVVAITMLSRRGYPEFAQGDTWQHMGLGVVMFVFTMLMVVSTDQFLKFFEIGFNLGRGRSSDRGRREEPPPAVPMTESWFASWSVVPLLSVFGVLALAQVYLLWPSSAAPPEDVQATWVGELKELKADSMPLQIQGWMRVGFVQEARPTFDAQFSAYWTYTKNGKVMFLSIDSSFVDWHNLFNCYRGLGWIVSDEKLFPVSATEQLPRSEGRLAKTGFEHGYVMFHLYDLYARPITAVGDSFFGRLKNRVSNVANNWQERSDLTPFYQVQVFMQGYTPATPAEIADMQVALKLLTEKSKGWLTRTPSAGTAP